MKFKFWAAIALAATLFSCDDTTNGIGGFVSDNDKISAFADSYTVSTKTALLDSVYSRTEDAYLGRYTDPDFGLISADFLTQINCPEKFRLPETLQNIEETSLAILYRSFYGDSIAPMRVRIDTLNRVINDNGEDKSLYYTTFNPENYYDASKAPLAEKNYAAIDYSVSDSIRNSGNYWKIDAQFDSSFSKYLFAKYQENEHSNFNDAHAFINNVLKGFYIHTTQGEGSVLYIEDIQLRLKVKYLTKRKSTEKIDSIAYKTIALATTKEVFMSTHLENSDRLKELAEEKGHTYLKTPAGLCTEVTFPLQKMYDEHKSDTLNSVSLKLVKYKESGSNSDLSPYKAGIPQYLLLLRKNDMKDFFEKNKMYDNVTSFLGVYNAESNSYSFSKLNRLISKIFAEVKNGKEKDENWNKFMLIPVSTERDPQDNIIGVSHDMRVNSARLLGGEGGEEIKIDIVFTQPTSY